MAPNLRVGNAASSGNRYITLYCIRHYHAYEGGNCAAHNYGGLPQMEKAVVLSKLLPVMVTNVQRVLRKKKICQWGLLANA